MKRLTWIVFLITLAGCAGQPPASTPEKKTEAVSADDIAAMEAIGKMANTDLDCVAVSYQQVNNPDTVVVGCDKRAVYVKKCNEATGECNYAMSGPVTRYYSISSILQRGK